jgi:hypothetical protein
MQHKMKRYPIHQSPFYGMQSRAKLAEQFGLTRIGLDQVLAVEKPYSEREIDITRNGKTKRRLIQEPRGALREIHTRVRKLLSRISPPDFLFCPVKRRSYVSNAAQHVGATEIRTLDVHAYFPSTPSHRVFWFFHRIIRCSRDVASVLAQMLTVDGHLATGSTVSPILSFYAFYDMWLAIAEVAKEAGCVLTVYMDDVTLSGDSVPERVVWEVRKKIHARGLHYHKERHFTGGVGEVTGVLIRGGRLALPNRQRKKAHTVRRELRAETIPERIAALDATLKGLITQQRQVTVA